MATERDLAATFTGMVAAGFGVASDLGGAAACRRCEDDAVLGAGDRVTATLSHYENHTWEPVGLFCGSHPAASVAEDMGVAGMDQAVIAATLEPTGYRDPHGEFHPDALTLGGVEIVDFSPAAAGYRE